MKLKKIVFDLKENEKNTIISYMFDKKLTCEQAANKIGITREQLYNQLNGRRNCSRASYQKIQKFIKKIEKEKVNA